jgi:ATP-binding cassette, subfamily B, bacterial
LGTNSKNIRADIANLASTLGFVYKSDKRLCLIKLVLLLVQSLLPLALLYVLKLLVDSVIGGASSAPPENIYKIKVYAGFFCAVFLAGRLVAIVNQYAEDILLQKLVDYISNLIHQKSVELDLEYYDNPEYHDTFHRAQQEAGYRPFQIVSNLTGLLTNIISRSSSTDF